MSLPLRVLGTAAAVMGQRTPKNKQEGQSSPFCMDLPRGAMSPKTPRTPKTPKTPTRSPTTPRTPVGFGMEDRFMGKSKSSQNMVLSEKASPTNKDPVVEYRPVLLGRATSLRAPRGTASPASSPPSSNSRRVCFEPDSTMLATISRETYVGRQRRIRDRFGAFRV